MGGRGRSRTQRKHFRQSRENVWKRHKSGESTAATSEDPSSNSGPNPAWEPFATQNPSFDEYYKEQGVCGSEEWDSFIEYLRKPLPAAFRINSSSPFYKNIRSQLENDFMKSIQAEDADGSEVEAIKQLPWYPDNLAWQSNFSRNQLRKNQTLEKFHEFLKLENEIGNITRQEAVSMVPPLFLDVRPDHFVLDMCAAPGSKTFQLLEMIYQLTAPGTLPSGLVIANDLDVQRCNLLIHQTKRMCTANLIVTNHEAQHFPSCHLHRNNNLADEQSITQLQFDRVLCDVPCSGDGTLRKAPDIWRKWNAGMGNGLHGLQVQIAMRGLALLKVGGRMVYSTCSMNPVENEAVVAEILRRCGESIKLNDVSSELPNLARRPGLKKWKVRDKGMWFASYKDVPRYRRSVVTQGMFPSGKFIEETSEDDHACEPVEDCKDNAEGSVTSQSNTEAEVSDLPLERCMRIVPHDQNSGAFFIAVFNKLSSLPPPEPSGKKPVMTVPMNEDPSNNGQSQELKTGVLKEGTNALDLECGIEKDVQMLDNNNNNTDVVSSDPDQNKVDFKFEDNSKQEPLIDAKNGDGKVTGKRKLQTQGCWRGVDPVVFYKEDTVTERIIEFYGVKDSFPFKGHLITRNNDLNHVKRIYYVSDSVKKVLDLNFEAGQQLKIASVGLKLFERQTSKDGASAPCIFRISSEGLPLILPHITKQILYASPVDFKHLLQYKSIKFEDLVEPDLREKALLLFPGCCVVVLKHEAKDSSIQSKEESTTPIAIGCWRGRSNISVMVTAIDSRELLERVTMLVCSTDEVNSPSIITEAGNAEDSSGSKLEDDDIVKTPLNLD